MKFLLILSAFISMQQCIKQKESIRGEWINKEDGRWVVKFGKHMVYQIYNKDTVSLEKYIRTSVSCDSIYLATSSSEKNLDFIRLDDGNCYEITGLSDSVLAYRHTVSGKIHVFYKSYLTNKIR